MNYDTIQLCFIKWRDQMLFGQENSDERGSELSYYNPSSCNRKTPELSSLIDTIQNTLPDGSTQQRYLFKEYFDLCANLSEGTTVHETYGYPPSVQDKESKDLNHLGSHGLEWLSKWRLHTDTIHFDHGPDAYDSGSSMSENEFDTTSYAHNMCNVDRQLQDLLQRGRLIGHNEHALLHDMAMNASVKEGAQAVRSVPVSVSAARYGQYDHPFISMLQPTSVSIENAKFFVSGIVSHFTGNPQEIVQKQDDAFNYFYDAISRSQDDAGKLRAIVELYQRLEKTHAYMDGNGRLNRAVLNGLLDYYSLPKTILYDPACSHFMSLDRLVEEIRLGQVVHAALHEIQQGNVDWQTANEKLKAWELINSENITWEYSISHGNALQERWKDVTKSHELLVSVFDDYNKFCQSTSENFPTCWDTIKGEGFYRGVKVALNTAQQQLKQKIDNVTEYTKQLPQDRRHALREQAILWYQSEYTRVGELISELENKSNQLSKDRVSSPPKGPLSTLVVNALQDVITPMGVVRDEMPQVTPGSPISNVTKRRAVTDPPSVNYGQEGRKREREVNEVTGDALGSPKPSLIKRRVLTDPRHDKRSSKPELTPPLVFMAEHKIEGMGLSEKGRAGQSKSPDTVTATPRELFVEPS